MAYHVPGELLVLYALAFNAVSGYAYLRTAGGGRTFEALARLSYHCFVVSTLLASAYLFYLFLTDNFSIRYVFGYSEKALPFLYKFSAFWGGQEGTYLLWLLLNALLGYLILRQAGRYRHHAMVIQAVINLFLLLLLLKVSPFAPAGFASSDGSGLNPLLQDAWMVIHPPVVFVGYSTAGVVFAVTVAALLRNDYSAWVQRVFPWVALTALALGAGNVLGGYWAYKTLGWGGYWGWDPVENASLIPWLVSLALLHGLIIEKQSGALRKTNVLLAAFTFVLVVYGTFLTRSGVLADFSVHSFVDLGANIFLIGFLVFFVMLATVLFMLRFAGLCNVPLIYNFYTREFALFLATVLLAALAVVILFWTSLPLITSAVLNEPRAADVATYNGFALPFAVLLCFVLAFLPYLTREPLTPRHWQVKLAVVTLLTVAVSHGLLWLALRQSLVFTTTLALVCIGGVMYLLKPTVIVRAAPTLVAFGVVVTVGFALQVDDPAYLLLFACAGMAIVSNLRAVAPLLLRNWRRAGSHLTHLGFGLMVVGVLASSGFVTSQKVVLDRGEAEAALGVDIAYLGMESDIMESDNRLLLELKRDGQVSNARPVLYFSEKLRGLMKKPFIRRTLAHDLYLSPEQVENLPEQGLVLNKGETRSVEAFSLTFRDFSMDEHQQSQESLRVAARVDVATADTITSIEPGLILVTDSLGRSALVEFPDTLPGEPSYEIYVSDILADQGAVVLTIPGLIERGPPDRLILDVSKKPLILLVWVGTTIILVGGLIVFVRRWEDARG